MTASTHLTLGTHDVTGEAFKNGELLCVGHLIVSHQQAAPSLMLNVVSVPVRLSI